MGRGTQEQAGQAIRTVSSPFSSVGVHYPPPLISCINLNSKIAKSSREKRKTGNKQKKKR